jgi:hypothetical protein
MSGIETYKYVLPSGAEIEIENLPEAKRGARDVAAGDDQRRMPFESVLAPLGEVCQLVFETLKSSLTSPETVSIELSASLKGKTTFVLVSGETQGTLKVTLTWKRPVEPSPALG